MAFITDCLCIDVLIILTTTLVGLITYYKWACEYWERRNMSCLEHRFPFGSVANPLFNRVSMADQIIKQYKECQSNGAKHSGMIILSIPFYMPIDPEYIKNVMSRDFNHFVDRGVYINEKDDPISAHLFSLEGAKWKNLRMKLSPTFTSGKMKMMFHTLTECADQLKDFMGNVGDEPVNIRDPLGRYTTDVIGSCAFGLKCNSFQDPNSEFRKYLKRIFTATKYENVKGFLGYSFPNLCRFFGMSVTPPEVTKFIMDVVKETKAFRENNKVVQKDFMQILLDFKSNIKDSEIDYEDDGKGLTVEEIAAQAFIFLLAGYETSSTTMTFCLFELSQNLEIQQQARNEINSVLAKYDGNITYDAIMEMKYLEQVIDETLRKYPPLPVLNRKCIADYNIPGTDVTIEKGISVFIPVVGLQRDEKYFPNPEKFDPERFSETNKSKIIPFTYLPFGEGPRICIGLRFGIMQTKVGLAVLLRNYIFSLNNKTSIPLKMDPASLIMSALGDIWLNVKNVE